MKPTVELYTAPNAMYPLFPDDVSGELERLATELISKSSRLSGSMNVETRKAIADFLRPMNSYYSNLIEGHDTHPIDIERALKNDYSDDEKKRDLQLEAKAHIALHKSIHKEIDEGEVVPTSFSFIKSIHRNFYTHLPDDFKIIRTKEDNELYVVPGELRTSEVEVGKHIAPSSEKLSLFVDVFEDFYDAASANNRSKIRRVISIAAAHHRLAWIHPFLDGNGRVIRLFSDAWFMFEELDGDGLWSISRGLARNKSDYQLHLANADLTRYNDYDGRGNLSNKYFIAFCEFFLKTAIDQIDYMYSILEVERMLDRIEAFSELMVSKRKLRPEAKYILTDVFLKGKISKSEAMRITNTSDKTLKLITDSLIEMGLLVARKESIQLYYGVNYSINYSPLLFPGLYPADKEMDMLLNV